MAEKSTKAASEKKVAKKAVIPKVAKNEVVKKQAEEFAVIETGGKQYVVSVGDFLEVELLGGEYKEGDKIEFDHVLMSDNGKDATIGTPYIKGAKVIATHLAYTKGEKVTILRYKAKSNRDRKIGHRQKYAQIQIVSL